MVTMHMTIIIRQFQKYLLTTTKLNCNFCSSEKVKKCIGGREAIPCARALSLSFFHFPLSNKIVNVILWLCVAYNFLFENRTLKKITTSNCKSFIFVIYDAIKMLSSTSSNFTSIIMTPYKCELMFLQAKKKWHITQKSLFKINNG